MARKRFCSSGERKHGLPVALAQGSQPGAALLRWVGTVAHSGHSSIVLWEKVKLVKNREGKSNHNNKPTDSIAEQCKIVLKNKYKYVIMHNMKNNMIQYRQHRNHELVKSTSKISKKNVMAVI